MPKKSADKLDLPKAVQRQISTLNSGKKGYKKSDALMDQLEKELEPGQIVILPNGKKVRFVDQWAGKSKVNAGMNVRRFAFEEVIET